MNFKKSEPDQNYDAARFTSESGQWEVGLHRVIFGVRVCANRVGSRSYAVNYCAGADAGVMLELLSMIVLILSDHPEEVTEQEIEQLMPPYTIRPINKDPVCWNRLREMAEDVYNRKFKDDNTVCP